MLFAGGGVGGSIPHCQYQESQYRLCTGYDRAPFLVWFLCCFTSDIFYSPLLAFALLNAAVAAGGVAAASSTAASGAAAGRANVAEMGN